MSRRSQLLVHRDCTAVSHSEALAHLFLHTLCLMCSFVACVDCPNVSPEMFACLCICVHELGAVSGIPLLYKLLRPPLLSVELFLLCDRGDCGLRGDANTVLPPCSRIFPSCR
jgi:hypothetical protein